MSEVIIKLPKLHPAQERIMREAKRFNVLKCGRRFGKTTLITDLCSIALDGFPVAVFFPTYKDLSEVWSELKNVYFGVISKKDEQLHQMKFITGGIIDMWSMEDPNSGRGRKYKRVIIDEAEKAKKLKEAWEQTMRATLIDYSGDAWFMSTPKFGDTYFKTLSRNKEKYSNWMSWTFTSYDNPHLSQEEINEAKAQLDELTFRCEFMAEDVDLVNKPFAYAFEEIKHVHEGIQYDPDTELLLSFDFNVDPITCIAAQHIDGQLRIIKSFKIDNSDIYELCERVTTEYGPYNPLYIVTGDASGRARTAITRGNLNYYRVIKSELSISDNQMKVPGTNPAIKDSRVLVNSMLQNYDIVMDRDNCQPLIYDLKYVETDEEGDIKKDRSTNARKADQLDCFRYLLNTHFKGFIKNLGQHPVVENETFGYYED